MHDQSLWCISPLIELRLLIYLFYQFLLRLIVLWFSQLGGCPLILLRDSEWIE